MSVGDVFSGLAFLLSGFALFRQRKYDELNRRVNELTIEKAEQERTSEQRADVLAEFIHKTKSSYEFRVYNRGKGAARNIEITPMQGMDLFNSGDIARKLPYPRLEQHQSFNLATYIHMQSSRRAKVLIKWDDDAGGGTKEIVADVF